MLREAEARFYQDKTANSLHNPVPSILDGLTVTTQKDANLAIQTCARHLVWLGARWEPVSGYDGGHLRLKDKLIVRPTSSSEIRPGSTEIDCTLAGMDALDPVRGADVLIQAISGLMAVHGRDQQRPRRLGLEVASVAAGIVATQGLLAALIGQSRGAEVQSVKTSVLQSALLFLSHHVAIATCDSSFAFPTQKSGSGPPFCTADGYWVELEMLTFDAWMGFWKQLGVEDRKILTEGWSAFVYRYLAGRCALPLAFHEATRRRTLVELHRIAERCSVALCLVRTYPAILNELGWTSCSSPQNAHVEQEVARPWTISPHTRQPAKNERRSARVEGPLAGLRVVEITSRLQGPLAGLLLQMLGAEVVKIEPPGGDFGRAAPPLAGSRGAAYLAYNRGKEVVELNYKQPADRARLDDLLAQADVFLHNWRSGRAEQLGLDFKHLIRKNPRLIYAHASGWGTTDEEPSPFAGDYLVQAYAGCGEGLNAVGERPFPSRLTLVDVTGGLLACEGLLAGIYLRERTGQSCQVDTSLWAGAMTLQAHVLKAAAAGQETRRYLGRPQWGLLDRPIKTSEGFLTVVVEGEEARRKLSKCCGLLLNGEDDPQEELIIEQLRTRSAVEWVEMLQKMGIPAAVACSDIADLPSDARVKRHLERIHDACWMPSAPWQFIPCCPQ